MIRILIMSIIFLVVVTLPLFFNMSKKTNSMEGYSNYTLEEASGAIPSSETDVLVQDTYPITGKNGVTDNTAADIWRDYPIFPVGSYDQITNNIRYPKNPDNGTCMPAGFCGALYKDKELHSNYITPLPPVNPECGTRVGYFSTDQNLLPFRTNMQNILY